MSKKNFFTKAFAGTLATLMAVTAGESGAAGFGLLRAVMLSPELAPLRRAAALDGSSRVLVFNTETATDRGSYRKIVGNFAGQNTSEVV